MNININKYFDLDTVTYWVSQYGDILYDISLISQATGEVITITLNEECFDELLYDMKQEYNGLKAHYEYISWAMKEKGYI